MKDLNIAIGTIKHTLQINSEEEQLFLEISNILNKKINNLRFQTGIDDLLLIFIVTLINSNKENKIFDNFENKIIQLLKKIAPIFLGIKNSSKDLLDTKNLIHQLILSSLFIENKTKELQVTSPQTEDKFSQEKEEEIIKDYNEIIDFIKKLTMDINNGK
ncbi:MAG: hypothetical protein LBT02_02860 [Rickettsiales bacterium]|jgi:hypothetical protein|nr:hypothetical protein [Rickettsiales bacterium]